MKNEKGFCKSCICCFSSEKVLLEHRKDCLIINGVQHVKLEKGFIDFNNFNKMILATFKIDADFECLLMVVILVFIMIVLVTLQNIKTIFLVVLLINLFVLMINIVEI